jgi:acetyltransferase-like isoleucine patch superfamily enzyme
MIEFLRNIIAQIFFSVLPPEYIAHQIQSRRSEAQKRLITIHKNSKLAPTAVINNLVGDPGKIRIGQGVFIRGELLIYPSGGEITIGNNCYVGEGSRIWSANKVTIGDNVLISFNVTISDTDAHEMDSVERAEGYRQIFENGHSAVTSIPNEPIVIGNNAWINLNSVILKGVSIGEGAIVAAGSIVTKNVDPYTLVAGNPAKPIKKL